MTASERKQSLRDAWARGEEYATAGPSTDEVTRAAAAIRYGWDTQAFCAFCAGAANYRAYHRTEKPRGAQS